MKLPKINGLQIQMLKTRLVALMLFMTTEDLDLEILYVETVLTAQSKCMITTAMILMNGQNSIIKSLDILITRGGG